MFNKYDFFLSLTLQQSFRLNTASLYRSQKLADISKRE